MDPRHAVVASCTFVEPSAPPSSCESGGNSEAENRPRIPVGTVAPHPGPRRESATIVAACERRHDRWPTGGRNGPLAGETESRSASLAWTPRAMRNAVSIRAGFALSRDAGRRPALRGGGAICAGRLHAGAGATCFRVGSRGARRGAPRVPAWRPAFQAGSATGGAARRALRACGPLAG